jgi:hypothetical protein
MLRVRVILKDHLNAWCLNRKNSTRHQLRMADELIEVESLLFIIQR